jgi:hypothetical protein
MSLLQGSNQTQLLETTYFKQVGVPKTTPPPVSHASLLVPIVGQPGKHPQHRKKAATFVMT